MRFNVAKPSPYSGFVSGNVANVSANMKEVVFQAIDYFDIGASTDFPYTQYNFNVVENTIFSPTTSVSSQNMAKVLKASFYALPAFNNAGIAAASRLIGFGVPGQTGVASDTTQSAAAEVTTGQQTTLLTPTAISDWVKIGVFDSMRFQRTQIQPVTDIAGNQALGTLAVFDPDDGSLLASAVQCMVMIEYAQAIPILSTIRGGVATVNDPKAFQGQVGVTTTDLVCQVMPKSMRNVV